MIKKFYSIIFLFIFSSCSYIAGPEGLFPPTKDEFLKEKVEQDIQLPSDLALISKENHYPVDEISETLENQDVPKPRQIFSTSGDSSVQLRRLGELMWVYVETLPSTSWPISKSYWDTSSYQVINADPATGEIAINFDESTKLKMKIEHGIKEASTEIFLVQVDKTSNEILSNPELIQTELSNLVNYFADSVGQFSGTSLAAQNLNEMKKAKIFVDNGQTVIELDLNFDRAWSSVTKAIDSANIIANDKDRSNGIFYVSYESEEEEGFFSFLNFGRSKSRNTTVFGDAQFEVKISEKNNKTYVRAYSKDGKIEEAEELISKINESLS
ncbi:MAG: outer membrane protein assembly factor BamC [Gammaproteobacteria bacterium]|jgi:outer membrane protein assembly factor BamC|nr:outer membrane protein assembly factor BamC [Pseudomonadota bacterium]NCX10471.1 outer membrane protein assembly factor BamC [Pseudomonadota bacterium]NCX24594.1 outer membrane protein assembly factor BamC [Pseudomonadota bacterium]NCX29996.1 outer membrane protein assembly factor BamC [Pseudomonadota bacterium]